MGLTVKNQIKAWGSIVLIFLLGLWYLGDIVLPFVLGGAIAYFLDPVADRLQKLGCSRVAATAIITIFAILTFIIMVLLIVPTLIEQTISLFNTMPQLLADLDAFLRLRFPSMMEIDGPVQRSLASIGEAVRNNGGELLRTTLSSAAGFLNILMLIVIVPVVAFYLLLDWDHMIAKVDDLLPRDHAPTIRRLAGQIDRTLASFIRGQGTVCLTLGAYYAIALMIVGLQFGLVVGFVAGLITFIPYIGALVGGTLAIGLGLFQFWGDWTPLAIVAGIFVAGQIMEGNVLTPKLVGGSVGLHPVWLLFALAVFGSLFGFVGLLVAVPVAASIGVVTRFALEQYQQGRLYRGTDQDKPEA